MTEQVKCKYCTSTAIIRFGVRNGKQQYWCKVCERKFSNPELHHKGQTDKRVLASALSCYFGGMPLDSIQRHLQQQYGVYYSEAGIYNWILKWSREAVKKTSKFTPKVGDTWIAAKKRRTQRRKPKKVYKKTYTQAILKGIRG